MCVRESPSEQGTVSVTRVQSLWFSGLEFKQGSKSKRSRPALTSLYRQIKASVQEISEREKAGFPAPLGEVSEREQRAYSSVRLMLWPDIGL